MNKFIWILNVESLCVYAHSQWEMASQCNTISHCLDTYTEWSLPCCNRPRWQSLWGQRGAHLGPVGPRWAPCWPHKTCYLGNHTLLYKQPEGVCINIFYHMIDQSIIVEYFEPSKNMFAFTSLITRFMGLTWGPSGADRTQVGPMLATWTLVSGKYIPDTSVLCIILIEQDGPHVLNEYATSSFMSNLF